MSSRVMMLVLASIPLFTVASTCSGPIPIQVDDRDRFTPSGRASYEILPGNAQRRGGALLDVVTGRSEAMGDAAGETADQPRRRTFQYTLSVEGEMTGFDARDEMQVDVGDEVALGATIAGPARVQIDADNLHGHVAGRTGFRVADLFSVEGILGLGIDHTEIQIRSGGVDEGAGNIRPGFLFGGRVTLRPIPLFDLYAQSTLNVIKVDDDDAYSQEHQVGVDLNLTRNVAVFGGYRWWKYDEDAMSSGSDVDLEIEGPTAGVALKF
jgi:opacity protein-like surface antigen